MTSNYIVSQKTKTLHALGDALDKNGKSSIPFEDLPLDVLYTIVSKLQPKEFARTSALSSSYWRCMWPICPRLTFDGVAVCKCLRNYLGQHTGRFIDEVNGVLRKHHGRVVETLEIRFDLVDSLLVHHLDNWVKFAVSSRTNNITLDLKPISFYWHYYEPYVFPFHLFDSGSTSHLQHIQLSFVSIRPPSQFEGFPNLRKLYLQLVSSSKMDLQHVLSQCCKLEWLCIDRCNLNDELTVNAPLSHLLYLRVDCCKLTKIEFHAVNLATFEYDGSFIPIRLNHSLKLQNANIELDEAVFQHALISLLDGLPNVRNLTLRIAWIYIEKQWLLDNPSKFSYLRHLQLFMFIYARDVDNVLYSVSFMRAAPLIEDLEVHFTGYPLWLADGGPRRQEFGQCNYNYLKNICITGFKGARGQVELLLHVVESAPALEVLTVDTNERACEEFWPYEGSEPPLEEARRIALDCLETKIPQTVKFDVI